MPFRALLITLFCLSLSSAFCLPEWAWVKSFGTSLIDNSYDLTTDSAGNVCVTGYFRGTVDFGGQSRTALGNTDIFLAKFSPSGNLLWVMTAGGSNSTTLGFALATDSQDNVYACGSLTGRTNFSGTTLVNPGTGGVSDIFICKYTANGDFLWAKAAGGSGSEQALALAIDPLDRPVVSGYIGSNTAFGSTNLSASSRDIFVARLDQSGNWLSARRFGGTGSEQCEDLRISPSGSVFLIGSFSGTCLFDTFSISSIGAEDLFVTALDISLNVSWVRRGGGSGTDIGRAIAIDSAGNIWIGGNHSQTAGFGGTILTTPTGGSGILLCRLSSSGDWLRVNSYGAGSFATNACNDIAISPEGKLYLAGQFQGAITVMGQQYSSLGSQRDMFAMCLSSAGDPLWFNQYGGASPDTGIALCCRADRGVYLTGIANDIADYGSLSLSSNYYDVFLGYLRTSDPATPLAPEPLTITRNADGVTLSWAGVTLDTTGNAIIPDGYNVYRSARFDHADEVLIGTTSATSFTDTSSPSRVYYYRITTILPD